MYPVRNQESLITLEDGTQSLSLSANSCPSFDCALTSDHISLSLLSLRSHDVHSQIILGFIYLRCIYLLHFPQRIKSALNICIHQDDKERELPGSKGLSGHVRQMQIAWFLFWDRWATSEILDPGLLLGGLLPLFSDHSFSLCLWSTQNAGEWVISAFDTLLSHYSEDICWLYLMPPQLSCSAAQGSLL